MKKLFSTMLLACALFVTQQIGATPIAYVTGGGEPWGQRGGINAMDNVFGSGNWDRLTFSNAVNTGVFSGGYDYLYIDGGASNTAGWQGFINANRASLEGFVADGGNLFLNAARWGGTE